MRDFFKPWRRKIGVVTLVIACMLMAAWVRSLSWPESIMIGGNQSLVCYASSGGALVSQLTLGPYLVNVPQYSQQLDERQQSSAFDDFESEWKLALGGFHFEKLHDSVHSSSTTVQIWAIPYWSIVIPLTMLSAYLLLSKRRQTAPQTGEPSTITGESDV